MVSLGLKGTISSGNLCTHVVWWTPRYKWLSCPWSRVELQEGVLQCVVYFQNSGLVTTSVAIIWCREDRDYVPFL